MPSWARKHWLEVAWVAWAGVNLAITLILSDYETVPFHFVWISLTVMYGYRIWRLRTALGALAAVCVATGVTLGWVVVHGPQGPDELTEVPLMAAVFLAMVWHVQRRQAAMLEVEQASAREREFVRAASHHLKTPIAISRGLAAIMRTERGAAISGQDLDDLIEELDRLATLADDMLLLAAAEQDQSLICAEVDLEDLLMTAASRRWSRTADRHWAISSADGTLWADRHRLDLVLDALLENAVRATEIGDNISVTGRVEGGVAVIDVADSGVGIAADALDHVFERFWSKPGAMNGRRGTGLGLPIAKALVEAHGGTIEIKSSTGGGTTVSMRLPGIAPAPEVDVPAPGAASPAGVA